MLPEIAEAADDRLEVLIDGGVRRGTDVLKALALGARAVLAGRAVAWGVAAGGEAGVSRVLALLREELVLGMKLLGTPRVADVTAAHVGH
jgi:4-hydroxymandelate oxidase